MPYIRIHQETKNLLEDLAGDDYSMDDLVNMLIQDFGYEINEDENEE